MLPYIILGLCVIVLNILDDVTTYLALHKLPVGLRAEEGNPIMAELMEGGSALASTIKELYGLLLVALFVYMKNDVGLYCLLSLLAIVVISNSFCLVGRAITKRKIPSLIQLVFNKCELFLKYCRRNIVRRLKWN